jgi:hypothetical protein
MLALCAHRQTPTFSANFSGDGETAVFSGSGLEPAPLDRGVEGCLHPASTKEKGTQLENAARCEFRNGNDDECEQWRVQCGRSIGDGSGWHVWLFTQCARDNPRSA